MVVVDDFVLVEIAVKFTCDELKLEFLLSVLESELVLYIVVLIELELVLSLLIEVVMVEFELVVLVLKVVVLVELELVELVILELILVVVLVLRSFFNLERKKNSFTIPGRVHYVIES